LLNAEFFGTSSRTGPLERSNAASLSFKKGKTIAVITKYVFPPESKISVWVLCDAYCFLNCIYAYATSDISTRTHTYGVDVYNSGWNFHFANRFGNKQTDAKTKR
jgi:hypothetical protein